MVLLYNIRAPLAFPPLFKFRFVKPVINEADNLLVILINCWNEDVSTSNCIDRASAVSIIFIIPLECTIVPSDILKVVFTEPSTVKP